MVCISAIIKSGEMKRGALKTRFAVCIRNDDHPASLEVRKIYKVLSDTAAAKRKLVRVIDESGEDYLYPEDYFISIELSRSAKQLLTSSERSKKPQVRR